MAFPARDYGAHLLGEPGTIELRQRALAAIESHPLYQEAKSYSFCEADAWLTTKRSVERFRWPDDMKAAITDSLKDVENCVVVHICTSDQPPEPLSGHGKAYGFVLHPLTFAVIGSGTGVWRS